MKNGQKKVLKTADSDLPEFILKEIANFFENYKTLQGVDVKVGKYFGKEAAAEIISQCLEAFK